MLGPAPGAEGTPKGDPALMPLGPEPCAKVLMLSLPNTYEFMRALLVRTMICCKNIIIYILLFIVT